MQILLILLGSLFSHASLIDEPLRPFIWRDQMIANTDTLLEVVRGVKTRSAAHDLREAARKRNNPDHVFGALIDRIEDLGARERFAQRFNVEHPLFGSMARMRALPPRFRAQLSTLAYRGVAIESVVKIRDQWINRSPAGLDQLQELIDSRRMKHERDSIAWQAAVEVQRMFCSNNLEIAALRRKSEREMDQAQLVGQVIRAEGVIDRITNSFYRFQVADYLREYAYTQHVDLKPRSLAAFEKSRTALMEDEAKYQGMLQDFEMKMSELTAQGLPKNMIKQLRLRAIDARLERSREMLIAADEVVTGIDQMVTEIKTARARIFPAKPVARFNLGWFGRRSKNPPPLESATDRAEIRDLAWENAQRNEIEELSAERARLLSPASP